MHRIEKNLAEFGLNFARIGEIFQRVLPGQAELLGQLRQAGRNSVPSSARLGEIQCRVLPAWAKLQ